MKLTKTGKFNHAVQDRYCKQKGDRSYRKSANVHLHIHTNKRTWKLMENMNNKTRY